MMTTFDAHDAVNEAHAIRGQYLAQVMRDLVKAARRAATHKAAPTGQPHAA